MSREEVEKKIVDAMIHVGIVLDEEDEENYENVDIRKYIQNSFHFISFVIELEDEFDIALPDQLVLFDNFASLKSVAISICELIKA